MSHKIPFFLTHKETGNPKTRKEVLKMGFPIVM